MMYVPRMPVVDRDNWLLDVVKDKSVLHIGCTDHPITAQKIASGHILHGRLLQKAKYIVGLDYDSEGISCLKELFSTHEFILHNAEELGACDSLKNRKFEISLS